MAGLRFIVRETSVEVPIAPSTPTGYGESNSIEEARYFWVLDEDGRALCESRLYENRAQCQRVVGCLKAHWGKPLSVG